MLRYCDLNFHRKFINALGERGRWGTLWGIRGRVKGKGAEFILLPCPARLCREKSYQFSVKMRLINCPECQRRSRTSQGNYEQFVAIAN